MRCNFFYNYKCALLFLSTFYDINLRIEIKSLGQVELGYGHHKIGGC